MKRMMSRNRSERTLASMTDRGEGSEEGLSTSREVPPKPAKLPSDTRTWSERYSSTPGPGSPFYSPPPSSRALRWLLVIYLLHVAVFCGITIGVWIEHHGLPGRLLMLTLFALFSWWRGYQIRLCSRNWREGDMPRRGQHRCLDRVPKRRKSAVDAEQPGHASDATCSHY